MTKTNIRKKLTCPLKLFGKLKYNMKNSKNQLFGLFQKI